MHMKKRKQNNLEIAFRRLIQDQKCDDVDTILQRVYKYNQFVKED